MLTKNGVPVLPKSCGKSLLQSGHPIADRSMSREFSLLWEYGTYSDHLHSASLGLDPGPPKIACECVSFSVWSAVEVLTDAGERGRGVW